MSYLLKTHLRNHFGVNFYFKIFIAYRNRFRCTLVIYVICHKTYMYLVHFYGRIFEICQTVDSHHEHYYFQVVLIFTFWQKNPVTMHKHIISASWRICLERRVSYAVTPSKFSWLSRGLESRISHLILIHIMVVKEHIVIFEQQIN